MSNCRNGETVYLVGKDGLQIYSLHEVSEKFTCIHTDSNLKEYLSKENAIFVSKRVFGIENYNEAISDVLTYGIDLETFEIITPIWSTLQKKFIQWNNCGTRSKISIKKNGIVQNKVLVTILFVL